MSEIVARGVVPRSARSAGIAHSISPSPGRARTIAMRSAATLTPPGSGERVAQRHLGRPERQLPPRHLPGCERPHLGRLHRRSRGTQRDRRVYDEHDPLLRARVDADQPAELDVDLQLLARLADRGVLDRLAQIDEAAGERPQPSARVEGPPQQPHVAPFVARDRARDRLWVVIRAVTTSPARDRAREGDVRLRAAPRAVPDALERGVQARIRRHRVEYEGTEDIEREDCVAGPLAGLQVIELAGIGPGPFAAMLLADMGADVVRVARPAEAANPQTADALARGRTIVGADLKSEQGRDLVRRLAEQADVLLEGFRAGVTERLGLGPDDLLAV